VNGERQFVKREMLQPFLLLPFPFYSFYHTPGFSVVVVGFCVADFRAALMAVLRWVMALNRGRAKLSA